MNICIYGGGHIAHALAAMLGMWQPVTLITHHADCWSGTLTFEKNGRQYKTAYPIMATSDPLTATSADVIFLAIPQFAYGSALSELIPAVRPGSTMVFVPAPACSCDYVTQLELRDINVVGFQRVPNIARITEIGKSVSISSDRAVHRIVASSQTLVEPWGLLVSRWFGGEAKFLSSFLTFTFNNSNPLLHTSRMVVLFNDWRNITFTENPYFYSEWTDESSELYLAADDEMAKTVSMCPEIDATSDYVSVREHYRVNTPAEMTGKLRSIVAFKAIKSPMRKTPTGWIPDFHSRYFLEDVDCGLKAIVSESKKLNSTAHYCVELWDRMAKIRA